jgi:CubicO group peptidase (beta-lactamase class C family)
MVSCHSSLRGPADQADRDANPAPTYYPDANWQHRTPSESDVSPDLLQEAIDFAIAGETKAPRDLVMNHYQTFGREPFGYAIGPIRERGDPTGIIIHKGYIVAEWGDPLRVDMTHSVTKNFLSSVVGIAVERGMIRSVDDAVRDYVAPIQLYAPPSTTNKSDRLNTPDLLLPFESPHNRTITWDNLLRQTSDWEGTLWGKPDWVDRPDENPAEWTTRPRNKPGTVYKYNDTRTNVMALAALNVWRRPLPQVLKENIMDPIGASDTWRWFGYLGGAGWQPNAVGDWRWALGRRHVYQCLRHGPLRLPHAASRQMERPSTALGAMDRSGTHADQARADLRVHELVS